MFNPPVRPWPGPLIDENSNSKWRSRQRDHKTGRQLHGFECLGGLDVRAGYERAAHRSNTGGPAAAIALDLSCAPVDLQARRINYVVAQPLIFSSKRCNQNPS
jgi:hypothetical protein